MSSKSGNSTPDLTSNEFKVKPLAIRYFEWQTATRLTDKYIQSPFFIVQFLYHTIVPAKVLHDQVKQGIH